MSNAPAFLVFDGSPSASPPVVPRRPSPEDVGGAHLQNDPAAEPVPETMIAAEDMNQVEMIVPRLAAVSYAVKISVNFTAGAPVITGIACLGSTLTAADFTVGDDGDGNTTIEWAADALPLGLCQPLVTGNNPIVLMWAAYSIAHGVCIRSWAADDTPTDCPFTVLIDGDVPAIDVPS